jgi:hypothetical protein
MRKILVSILLSITAAISFNLQADIGQLPAGEVNGDAGVVNSYDLQPNPNPLLPNAPLNPSGTMNPPPPALQPANQEQINNQPYVPGPADNPANNQMMEKCKVLDSDGNGLIKAYMADSGPNLEGDASAWIWVPYGQCVKINHGDFNGVSAAIRAKINPSDLTNAQTIE